jgi:hypothetical protein
VAFSAVGLLSRPAPAAEPPVNTGLTSFMDGFGDPTGDGFAYQNYARWATADSIKDANGNDVSAFKTPRLNVFVDLNQFLYSFKVPATAVVQPGVNLMVPLVYTNATFGAGGPSLQDNGFGLGDIVLGPFAQFKPILVGGHPVFSHRFEFDVQAPTGKYDPTKDINPGCNAWALNPYWAATLIPFPRVELTTRINYLYNFTNNNPGYGLTSSQEGQAIFDDFAVAFEVLPHDGTRTAAHSLRVGLNGYYFKQITQNQANGASQSGSLEQVLGLGPGVMWVPTDEDAFFLNAYFETAVQNRFASDVYQLRWARAFSGF